MVKNNNSQSGRRKKPDKVKTKSERRESAEPRRKSKPQDENNLYKLPKSDIEKFIETERRHDELSRMNEVQEQRRVWKRTILTCLLLNLTFVVLAIIGSTIK